MTFARMFYAEQDLARERKNNALNNNPHVERLMVSQAAFFLQLGLLTVQEKGESPLMPIANLVLSMGYYLKELHQSFFYKYQPKDKAPQHPLEEETAINLQTVEAPRLK